MSIMRKKSIVVLLITLLCSGAIADAASGIGACPPKQCCCAPTSSSMNMGLMDHKSPMGMMDHGGPMEMELPHGCATKKSAPCCNLESDVQPNVLAISTVSNADQFRHLTAQLAADIHIDTPLVQTHITKFRDVGWPKIPKIPIFLQTLSILC